MSCFQKQGLLLGVLILIFLVVFFAAVIPQRHNSTSPQIVTAQFSTAAPAHATVTAQAGD